MSNIWGDPKAAFLTYDAKVKEAFFDRDKIIRRLDEKIFKLSFWFAGQVRSRTRSYIGKPNIEGRLITQKQGPPKEEKRRKPRTPPKPPIARTLNEVLTLRNIQYTLKREGDSWAVTRVFGIRFPRTQTGSKPVPEIHEFGGTVRAHAKVVTVQDIDITLIKPKPKGKQKAPGEVVKKPRRKRKRKIKPKNVQSMLIFNRSFPRQTFKIPARPYLGPTFDKLLPKLNEKIDEGRFG